MAKPRCEYCQTIIEEARDYFALNGVPVHVGCVQSYMPTKTTGKFVAIDKNKFWGNTPEEERK